MKSITTILTAFTITLAGNFCHAQQAFDKIRLGSPAKVELKQGPSAITIDGQPIQDPDQYYHIGSDGWLEVSGIPAEELEITLPTLTKIDVSGPGKLEMSDLFKGDVLDARVTGAGKMELNLEYKQVNAVISGAGKIEMTGTADKLEVEISGSGKVDAENMKVKDCTASISGSGKCLVDVTDNLTSNITGSGSIYYVTPPAHMNNNVTGIGRVGDVDETESDTTKVMLGKKKILIIDGEGKNIRLGFKDTLMELHDRRPHSHWAGFELGVNMLMNEDMENEAPAGYEFLDQRVGKSIAVNFNVADFEIPIYRKYIFLVTGMGFTINNYRFTSDNQYLAADKGAVSAITMPENSLKKNKLVVNYVTVPLLLEFNTKENYKKSAHLAFGMIGGVRTGSHVKLITKVNGEESKKKVHDDFNLNRWRYDATVRLGYGNFTVFGSYDLAGLFNEKQGPDVKPLTLGLRVVGW